jgi:hypothetical protein
VIQIESATAGELKLKLAALERNMPNYCTRHHSINIGNNKDSLETPENIDTTMLSVNKNCVNLAEASPSTIRMPLLHVDVAHPSERQKLQDTRKLLKERADLRIISQLRSYFVSFDKMFIL